MSSQVKRRVEAGWSKLASRKGSGSLRSAATRLPRGLVSAPRKSAVGSAACYRPQHSRPNRVDASSQPRKGFQSPQGERQAT